LIIELAAAASLSLAQCIRMLYARSAATASLCACIQIVFQHSVKYATMQKLRFYPLEYSCFNAILCKPQILTQKFRGNYEIATHGYTAPAGTGKENRSRSF
jgi:hypothetical protein